MTHTKPNTSYPRSCQNNLYQSQCTKLHITIMVALHQK